MTERWTSRHRHQKDQGHELLTLTAFRDGTIRSTWLDPQSGQCQDIVGFCVNNHFPALTLALPEVAWDEREIHDLFGFIPDHHPDLRPLVRTPRWPASFFPLRDRAPSPIWDDVEPDLPALTVQGDGIIKMKVGPTHAGIIESGHFVFSLIGENVLALDAHLFQNHRGLEHFLEGQMVGEVSPLVSRICAADSVSHQVNWAMAVEQLAGFEPSLNLQRQRVLLLEAERVTSHLNDLAQIPAGVGFSVAHQKALAMKEAWQRQLFRLFGHRFLFDVVRPGWAHPASTASAEGMLLATRELRQSWRLWRKLVEDHHGLQDRMRGVGITPSKEVTRLGATGVARRAAGQGFDARPLLNAYAEFHPVIVQASSADVDARFRVRLAEVEESLRLIEEAAVRLGHGQPLPAWTPDDKVSGRAVTFTESPHGLNAHDVTLIEGRVDRYHIRSGTYRNWPLLAQAVSGNAVADFPLINKSFELCYSCTDR